jgi:hypothetical protein
MIFFKKNDKFFNNKTLLANYLRRFSFVFRILFLSRLDHNTIF